MINVLLSDIFLDDILGYYSHKFIRQDSDWRVISILTAELNNVSVIYFSHLYFGCKWHDPIANYQ
jgi:hypothetical protein